MTTYTVTIVPDDTALAVTTIRLDITGTAATVRELRLVPGTSGGLTPGGLPVLDLNHLVAAVIAAVVPEPVAMANDHAAAPVDQPRPVRQAGPAVPRQARKRGDGARSTEDDTATAPPRKKAGGKAPAKAAKKTTAARSQQGSGRTYRRVPDDFDQVLRQAGDSAAVIADHYDVPRHTAYGWIRSARKKASTAV